MEADILEVLNPNVLRTQVGKKKTILSSRTNQKTYINELFLKWTRQSKKRFVCGGKYVCVL